MKIVSPMRKVVHWEHIVSQLDKIETKMDACGSFLTLPTRTMSTLDTGSN